MTDETLGAQMPMGGAALLPEDLFESQVPFTLIAADVDRVKDYVFESARLPEVRGASSLLTEVNERGISQILEEQFALPKGCLLYAGGGSALIVVPTSVAGAVVRAIERRYLEVTGAATISVVHHPFAPEQWKQGLPPDYPGFGGLVNWLGHRLRLAKESRSALPFFPIPAYARACDSCQRRPASEHTLDPDGEPRRLCQICQGKQRAGRNSKSSYLRELEDFLRTRAGETPYGQQLASLPVAPEPAPSLDEIGAAGHGRAQGYVGLIYADGNGVGKWLRRCTSPADYSARSQQLRHAARGALFAALAAWPLAERIQCVDGVERWLHPIEVLAIGGDDVFLIVAGDVALDVAVQLCEDVGRAFAGELTMSAGVCIMPAHFPIYHGRDICEALLKHAKRVGRALGGNGAPPALIDFHVLTGESSLMDDVAEFRDAAHRLQNVFQETLTERPYSAERLGALLRVARWLKTTRFPASQLFQLRRAVAEDGWVRSGNWHRYQVARGAEQDGGYRELHRQFVSELGLLPEHAPWRWAESRFSTPVVDLAEIVDYVRIR